LNCLTLNVLIAARNTPTTASITIIRFVIETALLSPYGFSSFLGVANIDDAGMNDDP
jgi:hypothetical protein